MDVMKSLEILWELNTPNEERTARSHAETNSGVPCPFGAGPAPTTGVIRRMERRLSM